MFVFRLVEGGEEGHQDQVNIGIEKARSMGIGNFVTRKTPHF